MEEENIEKMKSDTGMRYVDSDTTAVDDIHKLCLELSSDEESDGYVETNWEDDDVMMTSSAELQQHCS